VLLYVVLPTLRTSHKVTSTLVRFNVVAFSIHVTTAAQLVTHHVDSISISLPLSVIVILVHAIKVLNGRFTPTFAIANQTQVHSLDEVLVSHATTLIINGVISTVSVHNTIGDVCISLNIFQ